MFRAALSARRILARFLAGLMTLVLMASAASAASVVNPALVDLKPEERAVVATPQPVQLLFEFQTNGVSNARATAYLKKQVTEIIQAGGQFSEVSEKPTPNGAVLSIIINNVADVKKATSAGVGVGLTFGLKGTVVTEAYICTGEYLPNLTAAKLSRTTNHHIYTSIGLAKLPEGQPAKNITEALTIMTRQIVSHTVNDLAKDPGFAPAAPQVATATPAPEAAPAVAPATTEQPAQ